MLVSLGKYLYGPAPPGRASSTEALAVLACNTLHALARSLLLEGHPELKGMKRHWLELEDALARADSPAEWERIGEDVTANLEVYRAKMLELEQFRASEIHNMISSLNQTVVALSGGGQRSIAGLQQIEKELVRAAAVEDIVALRSRLSQCLQVVREETAREREEVARNVLRMQETITRASESFQPLRDGVAGRSEAELLLRSAFWDSGSSFAAVFVLDRLHSITSRFGAAAAEEVMEYFFTCLDSKIRPPKHLFQWSDSAALVLLERAHPKWEVLAEIQNVDWSALEKQLETGERVAVLSLSNHWTVMAQAEMPEREKLIAGIERFVDSGNE